MAKIFEIEDLDDKRVAPFGRLTEAQLRNRLSPANAIFIAESPKVIRIALDNGYLPLSMLCERRHVDGDAAEVISIASKLHAESGAEGDFPVYVGERELLSQLTGYTLTRGVLCAFRRKESFDIEGIAGDAKRIAVIDGVVDTTNIGSIFRSAAALGIDAVLLTPQSCDPLNRRSVRVSMGTVFLVPWGWIDDINRLKPLGFKTVALALTDSSVSIEDPSLCGEPRLAMILGTEGDGLSAKVISEADYTARIPMSHGVDSLNVGAAAAVAFWQLRKR